VTSTGTRSATADPDLRIAPIQEKVLDPFCGEISTAPRLEIVAQAAHQGATTRSQ
jgi:hypothetical protein